MTLRSIKGQRRKCPSVFTRPWAPRYYAAWASPPSGRPNARHSVFNSQQTCYSFYRPREGERLSDRAQSGVELSVCGATARGSAHFVTGLQIIGQVKHFLNSKFRIKSVNYWNLCPYVSKKLYLNFHLLKIDNLSLSLILGSLLTLLLQASKLLSQKDKKKSLIMPCVLCNLYHEFFLHVRLTYKIEIYRT